MGTVIDLFARRHREQGEEPVTPSDYPNEREFVEGFMEEYMGEFLAEVHNLDQCETVGELEDRILAIKALIGQWPEMPTP